MPIFRRLYPMREEESAPSVCEAEAIRRVRFTKKLINHEVWMKNHHRVRTQQPQLLQEFLLCLIRRGSAVDRILPSCVELQNLDVLTNSKPEDRCGGRAD